MRVLLVDDHALFLEGMHHLLFANGVEVVGLARDGLEAVEKARELSPDIILMDIRMPRCDGIAATRQICAERPDSRIVMLTTSDDEKDLLEAVRSGACGYLLKTLETKKLVAYLTAVMNGEAVLSGTHASILLQEVAHKMPEPEGISGNGAEGHPSPPLTPRQMEVLELVTQGLSYKQVGSQLNLTEATIKYHMGVIGRTLELKNRDQVVAYALRTGLVKQT